MLLNCGIGKSLESLGLQENQTSESQRKSVLNIHWKDCCWCWSSNTLATWCKELTIQFSSVDQSCLTICNPMNWSMTGFLVHHQLPEFTQTHVHWISDATQPSHPLSSPSPTFNLSQDQGLFKWVSSLHQVAKVLKFQHQHQSFQWIIFRTNFL